jgi:hypothetical protein
MFVLSDDRFAKANDKEVANDLIRMMLTLTAQAAKSQVELDDLLAFISEMKQTSSCMEKTGKLLKTVNRHLLVGCSTKKKWIEKLFLLSVHVVGNLDEFCFGAFSDFMQMWIPLIEEAERSSELQIGTELANLTIGFHGKLFSCLKNGDTFCKWNSI